MIIRHEQKFEKVFQVVRTTVQESLGLACIRHTDPSTSALRTMWEAVQRTIELAEIVIVDLSEPTPNLLLDCAYAIGLQKPMLTIGNKQTIADSHVPYYPYIHYQLLEDSAPAEDFAFSLNSRLRSLLPPKAPLGEGIPSEIALSGSEQGPVTVEDYANLLRDLVFLHDHLWIAASDQARDYDLSAGYFYTRHGRPVPESQQLILRRARIGSPFNLQMLIPSATFIASVAVAYYQIVQAHRTRKLLPGELRRQALDERKLRRELDATPSKTNANGQNLDPYSPEDQRPLEGLLRDLPGFVGDRKATIMRVVQRDLDRISRNPIKITEVVVVRTIEPERK